MEDWKGTGTAGSNSNFGDSSASGPIAGGDPLASGSFGQGSTDAGHGGTIDKAKHSATEAVGTVKEQLATAGQKATGAAGQATEKAAAGLHTAADKLRERGGDSQMPAAATVADRLDSAASAVESVSSDQMVEGLESLVRRNPTQALLVAAGAGFLLARATR